MISERCSTPCTPSTLSGRRSPVRAPPPPRAPPRRPHPNAPHQTPMPTTKMPRRSRCASRLAFELPPALVAALTAAAFLAGSARAPLPGPGRVEDELRTRRLVLVDGEGRERAVAEVSGGGAAELTLLDPAGRATHRLGLDAEGRPNLTLVSGEEAVHLRALGGGGGELVARAPGEDGPGGGFSMGVDAAGQGALSLHNAAGRRVLFAGATSDGDGAVRVDNRDGTRAFYMGDDPRGNGVVAEDALPGGRLWR